MRRAGIGEVTNDRGRQVRVLLTYPQHYPPRSVLSLYTAFTKLQVEARLKPLDEVSCDEFSEYDVVMLRGFPYNLDLVTFNALVTCMEDTLTINNPRAIVLARDKYSSIKILEKEGVPVPKTRLVKGRGELVNAINEMGIAVVKPLSSSLGIGVQLVTRDSLGYFLSSFPFRFNAVVQEYVEKVRDVRVFVIGDKAVGAMYRISPLTFVTNYSQGADLDPAPVEPYETVAIRATKALGLEYAGVDLVESPEGPKVIEVNPSPQWLGLSRILRKDIAMILAKYVTKRAREVKTGSEL